MATEIQNSSVETKEISLKDLILKIREWVRYLRSKWIVIVIIGIFGGALGLIYAFAKKPIYTATTTFVLEDEKGAGTSGLLGLASLAGMNLGGGDGIFKGDNILDLYKSRTMLVKTLLTEVDLNGKNQLLVEHFIEFNDLKRKWAKRPDLLKLHFKVDSLQLVSHKLTPNRIRDSVLGVISDDINRNYLNVSKPDKKTGTIQVDVKSKDELFSKAFNDGLVSNVNSFYVATKTKKTLETVLIMQHKTDSIRGVMNGAIYTAVAVTDATPNLNPTRQVQRMVPTQKAQFSAETNRAILGEMVKNLEMAKLTLAKETPLVQIIDQPIYPLKKSSLSKILGAVAGIILSTILICFLLIVRRTILGILKS